MSSIKHSISTPIKNDPNNVRAVVDEALDGEKAVPVELVLKASDDSTFNQVNETNGLPVQVTGSNVLLRTGEQRVFLKNSPAQLSIPTYDGSGQAVHPSILRIPQKLNGYEYWMAMTPYPNTNDDYENPSILCSEDGVNWMVPPGVTNPLIPAPADVATGGYNSDPELVFFSNKLRIYYRNVSASSVVAIKYIESTNGATWGSPVSCTYRGGALFPTDPVSPAIQYLAAYGWVMTTGDLWVYRSADGVDWGVPHQALGALTNAYAGAPWHVGSYANQAGLFFISNTRERNNGGNDCLFFGHSPSVGYIDWDRVPFLTPKAGTFYSLMLYRSSVIRLDSGDYRIYFSAKSLDGKWGIGYVDAEIHVPANNSLTRTLSSRMAYQLQVAPSSNVILPALDLPGSKYSILVRASTSIDFKLDVDYVQTPVESSSTIYTENLIAAGVKSMVSSGVKDRLASIRPKITNNDASNTLTVFDMIITVYP